MMTMKAESAGFFPESLTNPNLFGWIPGTITGFQSFQKTFSFNNFQNSPEHRDVTMTKLSYLEWNNAYT
jgi:hypothetical protein